MKLTFLQLEMMLDELTQKLANQQLTLAGYVEEVDRLIEFAGWTRDEFLNVMDEQWSPVQNETKSFHLLFKC